MLDARGKREMIDLEAQANHDRHEARRLLLRAVHALTQDGKSASRIARALQIECATVRKLQHEIEDAKLKATLKAARQQELNDAAGRCLRAPVYFVNVGLEPKDHDSDEAAVPIYTHRDANPGCPGTAAHTLPDGSVDPHFLADRARGMRRGTRGEPYEGQAPKI